MDYREDLLRSVPLIMCGHLKLDFFQASTASSFDINLLSTCPMMIVKYSGQAPRPFPHPFYGMSAHEMSGHDPYVGSFDLISLPNEILCVHCIKRRKEYWPLLL